MAKMGWKQGEGLGKHGQGITTPLKVRKTDKVSGTIEPAPELKPKESPKPPPPPPPKAQQPPSRVVLLQNMVGPGEVDDELEDEVANECEKFGVVIRCLIFEVTDPGFPAEEAVRIFVEFADVEAARRAKADLDGRFFGGRTVRASYFGEEAFARQELAPLRA